MIKYVLLDVDDTLLDFHRAEANAIRKTFSDVGIEPTAELIAHYSAVNLGQWQRMEKGLTTRERLLTERFDILYAELGLKLSSEKTQAIYEEYLSREAYFTDGAEKLLDALFGKYELYVVSNGTALVQSRRIESTGIAKYFKEIFISEYIGIDKPAKAFFDACFEKIGGIEKDKCIIVGDSLSSDIRGGINAGIKTCWFNPNGKVQNPDVVPDFEIRSLSELPKLLESI